MTAAAGLLLSERLSLVQSASKHCRKIFIMTVNVQFVAKPKHITVSSYHMYFYTTLLQQRIKLGS